MKKRRQKKSLVTKSQEPQQTISHIDGKITFEGAVDKYWVELSTTSYRWSPGTQKTYLNDYKKYLAPHFRGKAMAEFQDVEYFEQVIDAVRQQKAAEQKSRKKSKKDKTESETDPMQHFRYILRHIFRVVSEHEGFANPFRGTPFAEVNPETQEEIETKRRTRIQKSFTPLQEYLLARILLKDPLCSGHLIGLLLMWVFGLRNGEACGLTYGDIQIYDEKAGLYIVVIHTTTQPGSRRCRSYGKTSNFYRILVVPPKIYNFLMERKAYIQFLIDQGEIKLPKKIRSIKDMPVACKGYDWTIRSKNDEISATAQKVFEEIGMSDDQVAYFRSQPDETDMLGKIAWDSDYTAYTCRRNMVSTLFILDCPRVFIERWAGHKLSDPNYRLHDFSHRDFLEKFQSILMHRPIVYDIAWDGIQVTASGQLQLRDVSRLTAHIPGNGRCVRIAITPYLPHEKGEISLRRLQNTENPLLANFGQSLSQISLPAEMFVRQEYHDDYKRVYNKLRDTLPETCLNKLAGNINCADAEPPVEDSETKC